MLRCFFSFTTFILFISTVNGVSKYMYKENQANESKEIIHNFLLQFSEQNGITIIHYNSTNVEVLHSMLKVTELAETNGFYIFNQNVAEIKVQTSVYIIILDKHDRSFIQSPLIQKKIISIYSTTILFFIDEPDEKFLMDTLELLWKHEYLNVFAALFIENDSYLLTYNGYKKFHKKIKSDHYSKNHIIEKTKDVNKNEINILFTFNDHTKIWKINECERRKYEGKDYDIMKTIFQHLNADLHVIDIDDTIPDPAMNPWFSSLGFDNKTDEQNAILKRWKITMLAKSQRVLENDGIIEVTYPHTDNAVTLLLPKRKKITKSEEVYEYITQPVWYIHFTVLIVLSFSITIYRKYYGIIHIFSTAEQFLRIMFTCSSYGFIGQNLEELLLLAWIIWCFLVSIVAQAKITSMLSTDLYENELNSLEDIYRTNELEGKLDFIIFGLSSYIDELAEKYEGSKYMKIIEAMVKVPMDENLGEAMLLEMPIATSFRMAIVLEHDIAKFYARHIKNRQDGSGRPYLHLMKHNLMPCFQVFHVTAGSPLLPVIDRKIRQLLEGGFIDYFKRKFLLQGLIDGYLYPDEDSDIDEYQPESINMDLAKYAFFVLTAGLMISVISFMIEILLFNIRKVVQYYKSKKALTRNK